MSNFQAEEFLRDVLGARFVKRSGDELIHPCLLPFGNHSNDDKNPAASLNEEKLLYNCFKCASGGSLLWATETILDIASSAARRLIEQGLSPTNTSRQQMLAVLEALWTEQPKLSMPHYSLKQLAPWIRPMKYLTNRGISEEVQAEMRTGVNLMNMDKVMMRGGEEVLINQPRLIIPHVFGDVLRGWTMRKLSKAQVGNKYRHTPRFPKKETLFNWDGVRGEEAIIVVESPLSVLKLKSEGMTNVVATFGAEMNEGQLRLMTQFREVILFPDGDLAGYRSLRRFDQQGNEMGAIVSLLPMVNLYVVDHGLLDGAFNERDAADYTKGELEILLADRTPAPLWRWREQWDSRSGRNHSSARRS